MNGPAIAPCRRVGVGVVAVAVLLVLLVAAAAPSGRVLAPMVGPVAAVLTDAAPAARLPVARESAASVEQVACGIDLPNPPPRQRSVLEWGLPPPRAPTA